LSLPHRHHQGSNHQMSINVFIHRPANYAP
jgi:hypothetical protein